MPQYVRGARFHRESVSGSPAQGLSKSAPNGLSESLSLANEAFVIDLHQGSHLGTFVFTETFGSLTVKQFAQSFSWGIVHPHFGSREHFLVRELSHGSKIQRRRTERRQRAFDCLG